MSFQLDGMTSLAENLRPAHERRRLHIMSAHCLWLCSRSLKPVTADQSPVGTVMPLEKAFIAVEYSETAGRLVRSKGH